MRARARRPHPGSRTVIEQDVGPDDGEEDEVDEADAAPARWNHNIHHHPVILGALPTGCRRILDVGCGDGVLTRELVGRAEVVVGLDLDHPSIRLAVRQGGRSALWYVVGDLLAPPFPSACFDAVVSVATLHHVDLVEALARMRDLLRPGGTLAAVGLARSRSPSDRALDVAGAVATRGHRLTKAWWETPAPMCWPPPHTFAEVRHAVGRVLPGARYRRHVLWRWSLVWRAPGGGAGG
jgi:SAM-dependent methyltransferase